MSQVGAGAALSRKARWRSLIASFLALLLGAVTLVGISAPAHADSPEGVEYVNVHLGGEEYDGVSVVNPGDAVTFEMKYNSDVGAGTVVSIALPGGLVDISDDFQAEIDANDAIEKVELVGDEVQITFKDPWPAGVHEGTFAITTTVNNADESSEEELTWSVDGEEQSTTIIVRKPGDEFENVSAGSSKTGNSDLSQFVNIDDDGTVTLGEGADEHSISYTLRLNVPAETDLENFVISDELGDFLAYDEDTFTATLTTWDDQGFNKQDDDYDVTPDFSDSGDSFEITISSLTGPAVLEINYEASLADLDGLVAALQAEYYELTEGGGTGGFGLDLTNTATFGEDKHTSGAWIGGHVSAPPQPDPGPHFAKNSDWVETTYGPEALNDDGEFIDPPVVTYTLTTDFEKIAEEFETKGEGADIPSDVIIREQLEDDGVVWAEFDGLVKDATGDPLTRVDDCEDLASFASSSQSGQFCIDTDDVVWINIGTGEEEAFSSVTLAAKLLTPADMTEHGTGSVADSTKYRFRNAARFHLADGDGDFDHWTRVWDGNLIINPDKGDEGHADESKFSKSGPNDVITVDQGETATVDYTFVVADGAVPDVTQSKIVDYVDWEIFDESQYIVTGQYAWWMALDEGDFDVEKNADGDLVIALSDEGVAKIEGEGVDKRLAVTLTLTTLPFDGKETKEMKNKAVLFGEDNNAEYNSSTESESTSFGREAEVRKRVYDANDEEWVETLNAVVDEDGELVQDVYVYRVEWIPRGGYAPGSISNVNDFLPEAVEFLGFVDEADAATGENATKDDVDLGGNVIATYDESQNLVVMKQGDGNYTPGALPTAYIAVRVLDASEPVSNIIGTSEAIIVPTPGPSIDIEKWTDEGDGSGPEYDDDGKLTNDGYPGDFDENAKELIPGAAQEISFTISNDGGEPLTDVAVSDETAEGTHGEIEDLVCTFPDDTTGVEWDGPFEPGTQFECVGALPGLEAGQVHTNNASVVGVGIESEKVVTDEDPWNARTPESYAIGDYVWVDTNRDGVQEDGENPLEGVNVTLTTAEDEPVYDVFGNEVQPTETDAQGRYIFDNLPAGEYKVHFELTEDQAEKYLFTTQNTGNADSTDDSDADPATGWTEPIILNADNAALSSDYEDQDFDASAGIDPTWDAGVILKSVSVGDYVWVDENRDGIQDEGEPGIPGVTLCLVGPDGEPVTDVFGDLVGPVVTDENGYYSFDDLPALSGEETYTVCIDREASEEVLKPYVPTKEHQGDDRGLDSSTWEASTEPGDLHNDGDRDPTLDFGFVTKSYAIGDYVWIDSNRDGIQDEGEDPLPGVTVELFDSEGDLVDSTTSDDEGRYLFDNLPAGEYKVKFTLADEQAAIYDFTTLNTGNSESTNDSDADPATGWTTVIVLDDSNTSLTGEYDRAIEASEGVDPTWDAGVVLKPLTPEEGPGPDPTPEQTPDPEPTPEGEDIPSLGAEFNGTLVGIAVALLLAGAATVALVRRES